MKWLNLEENLSTWVRAQRDNNRAVSTVAIKLKAKVMASEMKIEDFPDGCVNWVYKFMKRNQLMVRARTTVGQKLTDNWEHKLSSFHTFIRSEISEMSLTNADIINMDEVPMTFDVPPRRTDAEKGEKTIIVSTTGHERTNFTVVLACTASGIKLKPMLIFKRVTMPRESLPEGAVFFCNNKRWMNADVMQKYTDKCFRNRPGAFFKTRSLLIFGSMAAHKESSVQRYINQTRAHLAVIPGGLTK